MIETIELGRRSGKRAAMKAQLLADAATPEDARLALEDLERTGIGGLDDKGNYIALSPRNGARIESMRFDG